MANIFAPDTIFFWEGVAKRLVSCKKLMYECFQTEAPNKRSGYICYMKNDRARLRCVNTLMLRTGKVKCSALEPRSFPIKQNNLRN